MFITALLSLRLRHARLCQLEIEGNSVLALPEIRPKPDSDIIGIDVCVWSQETKKTRECDRTGDRSVVRAVTCPPPGLSLKALSAIGTLISSFVALPPRPTDPPLHFSIDVGVWSQETKNTAERDVTGDTSVVKSSAPPLALDLYVCVWSQGPNA